MNNTNKIIITILICINFNIIKTKEINIAANKNHDFIEKFITDYGFKPRDRYTHEYNSALLDKTAVSLDQLEEELTKNNFDLEGRIIITGYEEQAFPSYFYRYKNAEINDEAQSKTNSGWTLKLHNIFGFLTGFLFKDLNFYSKYWFNDKHKILEHIDSNEVEIFDSNAQIIHEHAFNEALNIMRTSEQNIITELKNRNYNKIIEELIIFWHTIYKQEIKVGNNKDAATQDILFSIEYAKHLTRSSLPFIKWYVGPDITYPIEISTAQEKNATIHAQKFVKIFSKNLKLIDEKPTVYVFCSFVDGVGKSTLLGNIQNDFKYGDQIELFDRVDNSSSQLADIFEFKKNIFIADLPAQVSHFTYKPDGYVYVETGRELSSQEKINLELFINKNKDKFEQEYKRNVTFTKKQIMNNGFFSPEINDKNDPQKVFIKNLILIKKEKFNRWIPFNKDGKEYIFNKTNSAEIRILTPLKTVQSEGLKNIEAEQMLFLKGVRLPLHYNDFMKDFITKLKRNNIEKIVFVDFTSMYPRSSRENVRINYLIQQLSLLDENFNPELSLYRNFVNDSELLYLLTSKNETKNIIQALELETKTRLALLNIIDNQYRYNLKGIPSNELTLLINSEIIKLQKDTNTFLTKKCIDKVLDEKDKLEKIYGKTKNYQNIQLLSFDNLLFFSQLISDIYRNNVKGSILNNIWKEPDLIQKQNQENENGLFEKTVKTKSNEQLYSYFIFNENYKGENNLTPFLKKIRTFYYSVISNLFNSLISDSGQIALNKSAEKIAPMFLKKDEQNKIHLVQRIYSEWNDKIINKNNKNKTFFNYKKPLWCNINNEPYLVDRLNEETNSGHFSFHNNVSGLSKQKQTAVTFLVQKYKKNKTPETIITTSKLYKKLKNSYIWKNKYKKMLKEITPNKKTQGNDSFLKKDLSNNKKKDKPKLVAGKAEQAQTAQLIIRLIATLEMIIKDPHSDIGIRFGNRKDFKAAIKILEKVTLPKSFGILFERNLFEDYDKIEPYPSWETWENLT